MKSLQVFNCNSVLPVIKTHPFPFASSGALEGCHANVDVKLAGATELHIGLTLMETPPLPHKRSQVTGRDHVRHGWGCC